MTTSVYELTTPRKPTLDDVGGGAFQNDPVYPPDPGMPSADWANQVSLDTRAHGQTAALARLKITNTGTAYAVTTADCVNTTLTAGSFTLTRVSAGVVQVTWASTSLPATSNPPCVQLTGTGSGNAAVTMTSVITGGVQVEFYNLSGTAVDRSFVLTIV